MDYFILTISWICWCCLHSGLISLSATSYLKKHLGGRYRFFRLFYNTVALATLIPVILYGFSLNGQVLCRWQGVMTMVQGGLLLLVISLLMAGALQYDLLQFLGIRQIRTGESHASLSQTGALDTSGILGMVRHPWYLAALIFIWISYREMFISTLIRSIILTLYVIIGAFLEERKLFLELGDAYRDYQKKVSMFFPTKWIFSKMRKG